MSKIDMHNMRMAQTGLFGIAVVVAILMFQFLCVPGPGLTVAPAGVHGISAFLVWLSLLMSISGTLSYYIGAAYGSCAMFLMASGCALAAGIGPDAMWVGDGVMRSIVFFVASFQALAAVLGYRFADPSPGHREENEARALFPRGVTN